MSISAGLSVWSPMALFTLVLTVSGCVQPPENPERREQAAQAAERFLQAVAGAEPDRGWALLHPTKRDEWGSERAYLDAVEAADWSRFAFRVLEAAYCDDGIWCPVRLEVPNGPESVPEPLRSLDGLGTDGILFPEGPGQVGNAEVWVVLDGGFMSSVGAGVLPDPG